MIIALVVLMNHSGSGQHLKISSGAKFNCTGGYVVLKGNLVNDGAFTNNNNTIVFAGTAQSLGGTTSILFNNLTVASSSTTTIITAGQTLKSILLSNGTMNADGNITLLSTVTQTALIDGSGTGQVDGNVTMQRYLPSGFGYKYFSSPFQGAAVNEFGDDMDIAATFPTLYKYDESRVSSGWVSYAAPAGVLNPMHGYAVNFGSSAAANTADVTGVVSNGNLSRTLYNNNNAYTKGFNLAGNPYPSPIDWDAATGWTKTNIDNALYYFKAGITDQYTGTYSTYINSISSDGLATNIIPSMQAFFVHVSDGTWPVTGTLAMVNGVRIIDFSHLFIKSEIIDSRSFFRLAARYSNDPASSDPLVVYFDGKARKEFDSRLDALKLLNTDQLVVNLYAVASDGYNLSINSLPVSQDSLVVIPLGIKTAIEGNITFNITDTLNLPTGIQIYLYDKVKGSNQILNSNERYTVNLKSGEYNNRFFIKYINNAADKSEFRPYPDFFNIYSANGALYADIGLQPGKNGTLYISNITGQILYMKEIYESGFYEFNPQLINGAYIVYLITGDSRHTKKIFILYN